jgi:hypothetical protein
MLYTRALLAESSRAYIRTIPSTHETCEGERIIAHNNSPSNLSHGSFSSSLNLFDHERNKAPDLCYSVPEEISDDIVRSGGM